VNFNPAARLQLIAGQNGVSATGNIDTDCTVWIPRVSFAYQLHKNSGSQRLRMPAPISANSGSRPSTSW
jgi:hypothetical protein